MEDIKIIEGFLPFEASLIIMEILAHDIKWHSELDSIDGQKVRINRKMAYLSDEPTVYKYANLSFPGDVWTPHLLEIKNEVSNKLGVEFNSVLLNYYKDGRDEIKWHADKEETLGEFPVIACVNLGAERKFWFRERTPNSEKFYHPVRNGDLLVMGENCQKKYLHAILKETNIKVARMSLTYRYNFS